MSKKYYYIDSHTGTIIYLSAFEEFLSYLGFAIAVAILLIPIIFVIYVW